MSHAICSRRRGVAPYTLARGRDPLRSSTPPTPDRRWGALKADPRLGRRRTHAVGMSSGRRSHSSAPGSAARTGDSLTCPTARLPVGVCSLRRRRWWFRSVVRTRSGCGIRCWKVLRAAGRAGRRAGTRHAFSRHVSIKRNTRSGGVRGDASVAGGPHRRCATRVRHGSAEPVASRHRSKGNAGGRWLNHGVAMPVAPPTFGVRMDDEVSAGQRMDEKSGRRGTRADGRSRRRQREPVARPRSALHRRCAGDCRRS